MGGQPQLGGDASWERLIFLAVCFVLGCVCDVTPVIIIRFHFPNEEGAIIVPIVQ